MENLVFKHLPDQYPLSQMEFFFESFPMSLVQTYSASTKIAIVYVKFWNAACLLFIGKVVH